jgi:hypothetical protein
VDFILSQVGKSVSHICSPSYELCPLLFSLFSVLKSARVESLLLHLMIRLEVASQINSLKCLLPTFDCLDNTTTTG